MKNNAIGMFLALGAACVCGSALDAQTNHAVLLAKIPFEFQVAGKDFAAGKYVVRENGYLGVPSMQSAATGDTVFIAGADHALTARGPARLVFHCYAGNACFLAEIRPATGSGSHVAMTKAEKEIANSDSPREMATISVNLRSAD